MKRPRPPEIDVLQLRPISTGVWGGAAVRRVPTLQFSSQSDIPPHTQPPPDKASKPTDEVLATCTSFAGITLLSGGWRARLELKSGNVWYANYDSQAEARRAYDAMCRADGQPDMANFDKHGERQRFISVHRYVHYQQGKWLVRVRVKRADGKTAHVGGHAAFPLHEEAAAGREAERRVRLFTQQQQGQLAEQHMQRHFGDVLASLVQGRHWGRSTLTSLVQQLSPDELAESGDEEEAVEQAAQQEAAAEQPGGDTQEPEPEPAPGPYSRQAGAAKLRGFFPHCRQRRAAMGMAGVPCSQPRVQPQMPALHLLMGASYEEASDWLQQDWEARGHPGPWYGRGTDLDHGVPVSHTDAATGASQCDMLANLRPQPSGENRANGCYGRKLKQSTAGQRHWLTLQHLGGRCYEWMDASPEEAVIYEQEHEQRVQSLERQRLAIMEHFGLDDNWRCPCGVCAWYRGEALTAVQQGHIFVYVVRWLWSHVMWWARQLGMSNYVMLSASYFLKAGSATGMSQKRIPLDAPISRLYKHAGGKQWRDLRKGEVDVILTIVLAVAGALAAMADSGLPEADQASFIGSSVNLVLELVSRGDDGPGLPPISDRYRQLWKAAEERAQAGAGAGVAAVADEAAPGPVAGVEAALAAGIFAAAVGAMSRQVVDEYLRLVRQWPAVEFFVRPEVFHMRQVKEEERHFRGHPWAVLEFDKHGMEVGPAVAARRAATAAAEAKFGEDKLKQAAAYDRALQAQCEALLDAWRRGTGCG